VFERSLTAVGLLLLGAVATSCATTAPTASSSASGSTTASPGASATVTATGSSIEALGPCAPEVTLAVLPEWAREGFNEAEPTALQALGRSGEIIAILFGGTLYAPPSEEVSNKILWVAKDGTTGPEGLVISAQRMDGTERLGDPVERVVDGGPGPSTIDLPEAGCWRMDLAWADETDSLDLEYVEPTVSP